MIVESTIEEIKRMAKEQRVSQSTIIETAIAFYLDKKDTIETASSNSGINSETAFYQKEIDFKNKEIERLQTTIENQTQLLGMASKKELLLIEDQKKPSKKNKKKSGSKPDRGVEIHPKGMNITTPKKQKKSGKKKNKKKK